MVEVGEHCLAIGEPRVLGVLGKPHWDLRGNRLSGQGSHEGILPFIIDSRAMFVMVKEKQLHATHVHNTRPMMPQILQKLESGTPRRVSLKLVTTYSSHYIL